MKEVVKKSIVGREGMSLLELMVAMTIFALVLVGIVPMMMLVIGYNREAQRTITARNALSNFSETIKTLPRSHPFRQDDGDSNDLADNTNPDQTMTDTLHQFLVNWNIRDVNASQQDMRIFVNWQDRRGLNRFLSTDITVIGN
jgi:prepilin-type N-terminal cleavage/methylation domain-containing protein